MSDFLRCKLIIKKEHSIQSILIQIGVFPDLAASEYKTLADERLYLNNQF